MGAYCQGDEANEPYRQIHGCLPLAILSKARWSPPNLHSPAQFSQSSEKRR